MFLSDSETKPQPEPVVVRKHGAILHFSGVSSDTMREPIKVSYRVHFNLPAQPMGTSYYL